MDLEMTAGSACARFSNDRFVVNSGKFYNLQLYSDNHEKRIVNEITVERDANPEDEQFIRDSINRYNASYAGSDHHKKVYVISRDDRGTIIAGLIGGTFYNWLYIDVLWVESAHRQSGIGSRILETAEREALLRGCNSALLDTFEFQAREFYERHGYAVFAELRDLPPGFSRYYMKKILD